MQLIWYLAVIAGRKKCAANFSSHFDQKLPVHYSGNEQNYIKTQRKYSKLVITHSLDRTFIARDYCMLLLIKAFTKCFEKKKKTFPTIQSPIFDGTIWFGHYIVLTLFLISLSRSFVIRLIMTSNGLHHSIFRHRTSLYTQNWMTTTTNDWPLRF